MIYFRGEGNISRGGDDIFHWGVLYILAGDDILGGGG